MSRKTNLNYLIKIALIGAIAGIIMLLKTPLAIFPNYLEIDISDVPAVIGAFVLGPVAGILIEAVKIGVNLILTGTKTVGIGELANFLIGVSFVLPAGLIYKKGKTINSAIIGMIVGAISMVIAGALLNYFVLLPFYAKAYNMRVMDFVEMAQILPVFGKLINSKWDLIIFGISTFNIVKGAVITIATAIMYKFIVPPLIKIQN